MAQTQVNFTWFGNGNAKPAILLSDTFIFKCCHACKQLLRKRNPLKTWWVTSCRTLHIAWCLYCIDYYNCVVVGYDRHVMIVITTESRDLVASVWLVPEVRYVTQTSMHHLCMHLVWNLTCWYELGRSVRLLAHLYQCEWVIFRFDAPMAQSVALGKFLNTDKLLP